MVQSIREGGDSGIPVSLDDDTAVSKAFSEVADNMIRQVAIRNANQSPTERVSAIAY
ncbi:MAG: hypothetical protein IPP27_17935 [Bacteroidetes bacterium]|nr:hypothetical protein [Bacteroidota bacterium]